jgi:hypothetical protein
MLTQFCGVLVSRKLWVLGVWTGRAESVIEEKLLSGEARASESGTPAEEHLYVHPVLQSTCTCKFWVLGSGQVRRGPLLERRVSVERQSIREWHTSRRTFLCLPSFAGSLICKFWVFGSGQVRVSPLLHLGVSVES